MPRYDYGCSDCLKEFEQTHSYKFTDVKCVHCESGNVSKILRPTQNFIKMNLIKMNKSKPQDGAVVEDAIQKGKTDLQNSKKELKGKVYKK